MTPNTTSEKPTSPNENLKIPKWITEDYFQPILEADIPNFDKVISFTPIAATVAGENYTSVMVRVVIQAALKDGTTMPTSYILKTALETEKAGAALVSSMNLFPKERLMYESILPNFIKLYKEAGIDVELGPKCLFVENKPECITLVMEDLKRQNFSNADRLKGFDMAHMTSVLRKLAELHAVSAVHYELNGPYDEMFDKSFFEEANRPIFEGIMESRRTTIQKAMQSWGLENTEYYMKKVQSYSTKEYFDMAIRINECDPNEFNVLNHGDCWANNVMFSYKDNGDIDRTLFVDFQVGKWGSPALDLWYLICTSAALDIKVKEFDHFIYIYHQRLVECLNLLKYSKPIPSLKDLHCLLLKNGFWGYVTSTGVLVAVLLPSDKDANIDNLIGEGQESEEFQYKSLINPYYTRAMCQLMPFFNNKGILDWNK